MLESSLLAGTAFAELRILLAAADAATPPGSGGPPWGYGEAAIDWGRLLSMADWHGLKPLLLQYLERLPAGLPPGEILGTLREYSRQVALRNLALASELLSISRQLESRGIEHLSYKGPLLASDLYGNVALRISVDLDIVVPRQQLERACEALVEIGYADKNRFTASQLAAAFHFGFEHTFSGPGGIDIDLHWRLVPTFVSPSLDEKGFWQRAIASPLCGRSVPTFCPEDLFFALCLHAGQHEWAYLSMFCDLARLLDRYPGLRWEIIRHHLADSSTTRTVLVSLSLLRAHWDVRLPEDIVAKIAADAQVQQIAKIVQGDFWPSAGYPLPCDSSLRWILQRTKQERGMDRLRYIAGIALNPTMVDYEIFKLPRLLMVLYPLCRGVRLALKGGRMVVRHVQNG